MLFEWFNINFIIANSDKSNLIISYTEANTTMIDGFPTDSSKTEFPLGMTIDHEV